MFRLVFRITALLSILMVLLIGVAIWKGGEPFRWLGRKTVAIGREMTDLGDMIDSLKGKKRRVEKIYKDLNQVIRDEDSDKDRGSK